MKLTDIFKFKLFERTDPVDMETVNENFESVEKLFKGLDQVDNTSDCDKNVASAKKAECDGNGKNISETYLKKTAVANNNTTTEAGYALDARQANPNVDGSLAKQISMLNSGLANKHFIKIMKSDWSGIMGSLTPMFNINNDNVTDLIAHNEQNDTYPSVRVARASAVLGSDKILGRWDSMLNSHTSTRGIDYYTLDTSVKPNYNSVDYAEDASTVDQKWNIYVILLLRRYNMIKILDMVVVPQTQVYFIRISILDKRLLQITDETKALIEGIRIKEWTKNERDFKTMSRAVKQGKRMCWSEMFFNSTYSMVSEYCAGCGNHKNIVEADPNRFELVKKVPAPIRRFSIELNNIFAGSHEAVLFADSDNTELIGRVINRGFSNVIINDDDQSSYFNLLNSISEWTDVNLFGMNEFIRLAEHGDYYYFAGDAIVLYGNTDQDIYKKLRRLRKTLASGVIRLLHVFKEDVFCKEVSKSVSSVIDGPVLEEYLIERM